MIEHAGLAGGVDLALGELRHIDARLDAGAAAHADLIAGAQKLADGVQHVEVDDAHQVDALASRQPCQPGRRIAVGVERKEGVAVHVGDPAPDRRLRMVLEELLQGSAAHDGIKVIESLLQLQFCRSMDHDNTRC